MNDIEIMYSEQQLIDIAAMVLAEAKRLGVDQAEVNIAANKGFSVAAHNNDVERIEYNQNKVVDITVLINHCMGSTSVTDFNKESIEKAVLAACHIAKFTDQDPASGLADRDDLAFHYPQIDLAKRWPISVEEAIQLACACEREALSIDHRLVSAEEVLVSTNEARCVYANSHGFIGGYPSTSHEINCVLIAKDKDDMQRDYSYTISADPSLLLSTSAVAKDAAARTLNRLGAKQLSTMKAPVIFYAEEARSLIGHFASAITGGALYRKASFLLDQLDQAIFPEFIDIQEFPHLAMALGSAPFDSDGVATRNNKFIEHGVLRQYALGTYSARKLGMKTTGNAGGYHNLTVKTSDFDFKALLKKMDKGLLVTELMGQGVNIITGDYSRGAAGFWVEHGEIQYPVHEITVAGNLRDIYKRIVAVGNDVDRRGNVLTGSILIDEMMIAGA